MMSSLNPLLQIAFYLITILILAKPLGWYIAQIYLGHPLPYAVRWLQPVERIIHRICSIDKQNEMTWKQYLFALLLFNGLGILFVYVIQRLQIFLPLNPQHLASPSSSISLNTAISFVTNTNWQAYAGERTMSYLTQMLAFTSQNFLSAATGMALLAAFVRGLTGNKAQTLGNYWVDMIRGVLYILLPLAIVLALALVSQGVIQTLKSNQTIPVLEQTLKSSSNYQDIPMGPVASQVAIKQLGSNGGGFFNVNAAHPFENPTPITNILELLAIMLIPVALVFTFGFMVKDPRQSRALLVVMFVLFLPSVYFGLLAEQQGNPALVTLGVVGGNMEGKEVRFGITDSVLWTVATTATSNGSVNSMLDSYMPVGGLIPLWLMNLGEVVFGGVGTGMYGMLLMVIISVFIGGLMVGRTPEYLGKKIQPFEMKMASIAVLLMPLVVLISTAVVVLLPAGRQAIGNPGMHGLTEVLYAMTSMMNNNGSALSGLDASQPLYVILGGFLMLMGRYWFAIPMLAISGSLVSKQIIPSSLGTLTTHTPLFVILLLGMIVLLGALSFVPVLALGPIAEQLMLG